MPRPLDITRRLSLALCLLFAGCGSDDAPELVEAGGIVNHNGAPLADAHVLFVPEAWGPPSIGKTGDDGRFNLTTNAEPGATLGDHKVSIQAFEESGGAGAGETDESGEFSGQHKSRIPFEYGNYELSGLTAEVTEDGDNDFKFDLTGDASQPERHVDDYQPEGI
jgi:hypothetical protein